MKSQSDRRIWNLSGYAVTYLHIDYRFTFDSWKPSDDYFHLTINTPFMLRYMEKTLTCDPENVESVKEALYILHKPLFELTAYRTGNLQVIFSDGTELYIP